jgi:hypothetical protein
MGRQVLQSALQRKNFFGTVSYRIEGREYSLDDIEHGSTLSLSFKYLVRLTLPRFLFSVLRGNTAPPGSLSRPFGSLFSSSESSDPRLKLIIDQKDPRIHFCLNCGASSCPVIRLYSVENLDSALDNASEVFIGDDLKVDVEKKEITISKIFDWYSQDFGKNVKEVLLFISNYASDDHKPMLLQLIDSESSFSVKYHPYNWDSIAAPSIRTHSKRSKDSI